MLRCEDKEPEGMWDNHKRQQKELEKLYEKKMKEREEAAKKYRKNGTINRKTTVETTPVKKDLEKKGSARKESVKKLVK